MNNATVQLEWLCETLNKRLGPPYNIKLEDLFLVIPYKDEAEFEFELGSVFAKRNPWAKDFNTQGNSLREDYPALYKVINSNKKKTIRVFFIDPARAPTPLVLWTKKYQYPKVSQKTKSKLIFNTDTKVAVKEYYVKKLLYDKN